jgi:hypothetical protein
LDAQRVRRFAFPADHAEHRYNMFIACLEELGILEPPLRQLSRMRLK